MQKIIETQNLKLIGCDKQLLKTAIDGNEALAKYLNVIVPENWTEFGPTALEYTLKKLIEDDKDENWWTYLPIHKKDNTLIGTGGYKGRPTDDGAVEIGYEIAEKYRNLGLATEFARALAANAFTYQEVNSVIAHTLGEINSSTKVLTKCDFVKVEEIDDPEDGLIWKWELRR
jgi:[ribosomal protein S5]-alanine N-acetyltransferase